MPQTYIPNNGKRLPASTIRRRNMQRRKRLRPTNLPITDPLLQRMLPRNTKMTSVIPAGRIIAKVNRLGQEPNGAIHPVAVAQYRFGDPPAAEAVIEWCER